MAISKIILNGVTQIDLTQDTVEEDKVQYSYTFHGADGEIGTGTIVNGDLLAYGLTDGTLPLVGVAQVGSVEI